MEKMNIVRITVIIFVLVPCGEIENTPIIRRPMYGRTRIVGGYKCSSEESNFMIAIVTHWGRHICGGTLLSPYWVLSAAHCRKRGSYDYACDAYTRDRYVKSDGNLMNAAPCILIIKIIIHPKYNWKNLYADIALMRLMQPIHESAHIRFVKLPPYAINDNPPHLCPVVTIMGWGITRPNIWVNPANLQCVQIQTCSREECVALLRKMVVPRNVICTAVNNEKDSCQGDSGGPLMCGGTQMGITSWGLQCSSEYPAVYTRVDRYLEFIELAMNGLLKRAVHSEFVLFYCIIISIIFYFYYLLLIL